MDVMHYRCAKSTGLVLLTLVACACSRGPQEEATHTVDYYRSHAEMREAKLRDCSNDPGSLGDSPNCVNVRRAEELESLGSLRKLPPMGLSNGKDPQTKSHP
jgi:hypothetical protein